MSDGGGSDAGWISIVLGGFGAAGGIIKFGRDYMKWRWGRIAELERKVDELYEIKDQFGTVVNCVVVLADDVQSRYPQSSALRQVRAMISEWPDLYRRVFGDATVVPVQADMPPDIQLLTDKLDKIP